MSIYHQTDLVMLYQGDCLQVMPQLEARSFDCILADLPYGTTACKWDSVIPFEPLWEQYKRLIKPNGAIVLFGSQPFTTDLIMSNRAWFKYCWVWEKAMCTGFLDAQKKPLKQHEDVIIFGDNLPNYYPQKTLRTESELKRLSYESAQTGPAQIYNKQWTATRNRFDSAKKFPTTILKFNAVQGQSSEKTPHPTQKPIALLEYLVRTYTNEGDLLLDNTCGSGSLLVAARNTNRRAVGIEMNEGYCRMAAGRLGRFEPSEFEVDKKAVEGQLGLFGAIACL